MNADSAIRTKIGTRAPGNSWRELADRSHSAPHWHYYKPASHDLGIGDAWTLSWPWRLDKTAFPCCNETSGDRSRIGKSQASLDMRDLEHAFDQGSSSSWSCPASNSWPAGLAGVGKRLQC